MLECLSVAILDRSTILQRKRFDHPRMAPLRTASDALEGCAFYLGTLRMPLREHSACHQHDFGERDCHDDRAGRGRS